MSDLSSVTEAALRFRQMLGREICRKLRGEWRAEEGAEKALLHYQGRVKAYTEELRKRHKISREELGEPAPISQVVQANVAYLGARGDTDG